MATFSEAIWKEVNRLKIPDIHQWKNVKGVTFDNEYALTLDDAIWISETDDSYIVDVSIAHITSVVPRGSHITQLASQRVATQYTEIGQITERMMPFRVADFFSLRQGVHKHPVICISVTLRKNDLEVTDIVIDKAALTTVVSYTQAEANEFVDDPRHLLNKWHALAVALDEKDKQNISGYSHDLTGIQLLVAQVLNLANRAVATKMIEHNVPALFLNYVGPPAWDRRNEEIRIGSYYASAYAVEPTSPLGAAIPPLCHVTSPLRRYSDLAMHYVLAWWIANNGRASPNPPPFTHEQLNKIALESNKLLRLQSVPSFINDAIAHLASGEPNRIAAVSSRQIDPVLQYGRIYGLTEKVVEGLVARIGHGPLRLGNLTEILFKTSLDDPYGEPLRAAALERVKKERGLAMMVVQDAEAKGIAVPEDIRALTVKLKKPRISQPVVEKERTFEQLLRDYKNASMTEVIADKLVEQLEHGNVHAKDIFPILFLPPLQDSNWKRIHAATVDRLARHQDWVNRVLDYAKDEQLNVGSDAFNFDFNGGARPNWRIRFRIKEVGQWQCGPTTEEPNSFSQARHAALVKLFQAHFTGELRRPAEGITANDADKLTLDANDNPLHCISTMAIEKGWGLRYNNLSQPTDRLIRCEVHISLPEARQSLYSATGESLSMSAARIEAGRRIIGQWRALVGPGM